MVILLSFFVFSCSPKKEEVIPEKNAQVLINKAKNWFKNQQKASSRLKSMDTTKIVYDWSKASWQKHYQMEFVEVPILYNGNYLSADLTTTQNNKVIKKKGQKRLLLRMNNNQNFSSFNMIIFADSSYSSKNPNTLQENKLESKHADFSGDIYFSVNDSTFLGGYHFSDNVRVGTSMTEPDNQNVEVINCISITIDDERDVRDLLARGVTPRPRLFCFGVAGPIRFPCLTCGDNDGGNGSGGGGGNPNPNNVPLVINLDLITESSTLNLQQKNAISSALNEICRNEPVLKKLYTYILANHLKINWTAPDWMKRRGSAGTTIDNNGKITVYINPDMFECENEDQLKIVLFEELIHVAQSNFYTIPIYNQQNITTNLEFESKFILEFLRSKNSSLYKKGRTGLFRKKEDYYPFRSWLNSLNTNTFNANNFDLSSYFLWGNVFKEGYNCAFVYSPFIHPYSLPIVPSFTPLFMYHLFQ